MTIDRLGMSDLSDYLKRQMEQRGWKLLDAQRELGVSKTAIDNILKNKDVVPKLETIEKFAEAFKLPVWRVLEMAGYDLQLPHSSSSLAQRVAALVDKNPSLLPVLEKLATYDLKDAVAVLTYMETMERIRDQE